MAPQNNRLALAACLLLLFLCTIHARPQKSPSNKTKMMDICIAPSAEKIDACHVFVIVIDAGSSGTRLYTFEFKRPTNGSPFVLSGSQEIEEKPGLSSYANNATGGKTSVEKLIRQAQNIIPKEAKSYTPITLKATAGLRYLEKNQSDDILNQTREAIENSGFLFNDESVSLMSGEDEGIYGWLAANFLKSKLGPLSKELQTLDNSSLPQSETLATFDLGGASTQITFLPKDPKTMQKAPAKYITGIRFGGKIIELYTHSYLGNGIEAARIESVKMANPNAKDIYHSSCFPAEHEFQWTYRRVAYKISGNANYGLESCYKELGAYITKSKIDPPPELPAQSTVLIRGYWFIPSKATNKMTINEYNLTRSEFNDLAKQACSRKKFDKEEFENWRCFDLSYITALLTAYGIPSEKKLLLAEKVGVGDMNWGLGAAFQLLNEYEEMLAEKGRGR